MATIAFIDTETTGLDPDRHEIWEVGMVLRPRNGEWKEYVWQLPVDLERADPIALNIGHFHDRRWEWGTRRELALTGEHGEQGGIVPPDSMGQWAARFVELTRDAHLFGICPGFDEERLRRLLRRLHQCPMWHYQPHDVEDLALGYIAHDVETGPAGDHDPAGLTFPVDSEKLCEYLGVKLPGDDKHTALGDARWAAAIYDAVIGPRTWV